MFASPNSQPPQQRSLNTSQQTETMLPKLEPNDPESMAESSPLFNGISSMVDREGTMDSEAGNAAEEVTQDDDWEDYEAEYDDAYDSANSDDSGSGSDSVTLTSDHIYNFAEMALNQVGSTGSAPATHRSSPDKALHAKRLQALAGKNGLPATDAVPPAYWSENEGEHFAQQTAAGYTTRRKGLS
ncbi:hypothetical protein BU16DRAFT_539003 [Lophium mytilinum]|uniref:Uncharacterized protein n=1 Tax=Lophium mytilinum TaxID=390894 RepID=A0A6A6QWE9_9PEZI|nr:hypothetical protein BU16DRAFT_539003 [Lophium mytilinum]